MLVKLKNKLSNECLEYLEKISKPKKVSQGEVIFLEGMKNTNIYYVSSGNITIYKDDFHGKRKIIYLLGEGKFLNESMIYGGQEKLNISAEAFIDSELLVFSVKDIKEAMSIHHDLAIFFLEALSKKVDRVCRQLRNTTTLAMDKRIASKLWKLSRDYGYRKGEYTGYTIKVSNTYLAEMLGTNRETVSRGIKKLKSLGFLDIIDGKIYVLREKLRDYYKS